jgi:hypothetical protein
MPTSSTQICNTALIRIGVDTITSLSDSSKQARLCNAVFQGCFDAVLEAFDWVCARSQAILAVDTVEPTHTWSYQYLLPSSPYCLRTLSVKDSEGNDVPYERQGRYLFTDEGDGLYLTYTKRVSAYSEMSPELVHAVAMRIAQELIPSFTWTAARKTAIDQDYYAAILKARINGAAQDYSTNEKENSSVYGGNDEWVNAGR